MRPRVVVVTGSDLGRSPRMVRHARALAALGCAVTVVGAAGHGLPADVDGHPLIAVRRLALDPAPPTRPRSRWAGANVVRLGRFAVALRRALVADGRPDLLLVQTPPGTPVVDVCAHVARAHGVPLALDWHNLEAGMVGLRLGAGHPVVAGVAWHERRRAADAAVHLAVTDALADVLRAAGRRHVVTFRDRPERRLPRPTAAARAALRAAHGLPDGPLLVMSSSYSLDDDLDLLVAGLLARGRPLTLLLTGDGPRRDEARTRLAAVPGLRLVQRFVDADDYLAVLGAADVGVCVHRSATGLDFPMKLTDYAAAGLPALALDDGPTLREGLGPDDRAFVDAASFAAGLAALLDAAPVGGSDDDEDTAGAAAGPTWEQAFIDEVWPVLRPLLPSRR